MRPVFYSQWLAWITRSRCLFVVLLGGFGLASAQELLRIPTSAPNNGQAYVEGLFTPPVGLPAKQAAPAVVLLHAGWGWEVPVTQQYAQALAQAGFAVLELRLFRNEAERAPTRIGYLQNLYDALRYLGSRADVVPEKVSVAGFSFGGILALTSATAWAYERFAGGKGFKFAAHAPFYPLCYGYAAFAKAGRATADLPADLLVRWTGSPVRIYAGGNDDYDDQDPKACDTFVSLIPEPQRQAFSVTLYPEATHGWDQPSASFYEKLACKGRGCVNRNVANPAVTARSIADLVAFVSTANR